MKNLKFKILPSIGGILGGFFIDIQITDMISLVGGDNAESVLQLSEGVAVFSNEQASLGYERIGT